MGYQTIFEMAEDIDDPVDEFPKSGASNSLPAQPTQPTLTLKGDFEMADEKRPNEASRPRAQGNPQAAASRDPQRPKPQSNEAAENSTKGASSGEGMSTVEFDRETMPSQNGKGITTQNNDLIRLTCKKCGRKLRVKKDRAGQRIKCPKCEQKISVPRKREKSAGDESSAKNSRASHSMEIPFAELAKSLEDADAKTHESEKTEKPARTKRLSFRKYRQLARRLENKGTLNTVDVRLRADALRELGQSGDARAYDWLVTDLDHVELQIRQAAAVGLGDLGDPRGVPKLVALLDEHSMVLRKAAILSLGKIKDPRAIKPLLLFGLTDPQMKFLASQAVLDMGDSAVQTLIELLEDNELGIVLEAVVLLGRLKAARARRALTGVIDSRHQLLQCHAIEALGQIGDPKAIGPLSRLLGNRDANIRVTAATALSKMASDRNVVAPLVKALKDPDEDVAAQAATGLGESGDKRAAEPLSRFLHSPKEKVRVAAAQALGTLGDERAVPLLLQLLDEESEETQIKVLTTLRTIKAPSIRKRVLKHLDHPKASVRRRVVDVLGPIGEADVAEQVEHVLRADPADEVRMAAARALGEIADPASVDCLKDAIHNDEFKVRCQAIAALGEIGDEECYKTLMVLLDDQVAEVRFHAAVALGEVGNTRAVPNLKERLKDKNSMVARGAAKALEKLGVENVEQQVKRAQRSRKMEALFGLVETAKSWLPASAHAQKVVYGGALAVLLSVLGLGWFLMQIFSEAPQRVVIRGNVQTISFHRQTKQLVVGRTFGLVEIWEPDGSRPAEKFTPPAGRVQATPNPEVFAIISGNAVQLWKAGEPEQPPTSGHKKPIIRQAVTPDQTLMGTMSSDGAARVWDLRTGKVRKNVQLPSNQVTGFTLSADGSLFAGGSRTGGVTIWNSTSGEAVVELKVGASVTETAFSPDGTLLAAARAKDRVTLWHIETGEQVASLPQSENLSHLQFDPAGTYLLGMRGSSFLVWETQSLQESPGEPRTIEIEAEDVDAVAISHDGKTLAIGGKKDSAVWLYNLATGRLVETLDTN